MKNIYAKHGKDYIDKGYSVIPDKYGKKLPAIKGWSKYCDVPVSEMEYLTWSNNFDESNIAVCLGQASGIIALDLDCTDEKILAIIEDLLPPSPVEKKAAKGWTRFFRFTGEHTNALKDADGNVVVELLSTGKKTTLPPSKHPAGMDYSWTSEETLISVDKDALPLLPPFLFSHLESKIRLESPSSTVNGKNKIINGRNDSLSSLCGKLIQNNTPIDEAITKLIAFDEEKNETPLFSDEMEMQHTERYTNALQFFSNHLSSVNGRRFRKNETYEIPIMDTAINQVYKDEIEGKSVPLKENQESLKSIELPIAKGLLGDIQNFILKNSFIPQQAFAFSASLALMSVLTSRKLIFETQSPNLYLLNIAPSGAGKDAPQQRLKEILIQLNADYLLGAGDYVSDASLTDGLAENPTRLDIMDECAGLLKAVNAGGATFNGKMSDILCELYTSSNSEYLGRAVAEGRKGACTRPNVVLFGSTTPTGFQEGMTLRAIEKGLMGRFLVFQGDADKPAVRLKTLTRLGEKALKRLAYWVSFKSPEVVMGVGSMSQEMYNVKATKEAHSRLDEIHVEFDELRRATEKTSPLLPIIARLYQQVCKVSLLHAAATVDHELPEVKTEDVNFGYQTIMYYFSRIGDFVENNIFSNKTEEDIVKILGVIQLAGPEGISQSKLYSRTRAYNRQQRQQILEDLRENEQIVITREKRKGKNTTIYRRIQDGI